MPRNQTVTVDPQAWVELTAGDATTVALQVVNSSGGVVVQATTGAAPTDVDGYRLEAEDAGLFTLAEDFPGVAGANRLWAYTTNGTAQVFVSHA